MACRAGLTVLEVPWVQIPKAMSALGSELYRSHYRHPDRTIWEAIWETGKRGEYGRFAVFWTSCTEADRLAETQTVDDKNLNIIHIFMH